MIVLEQIWYEQDEEGRHYWCGIRNNASRRTYLRLLTNIFRYNEVDHHERKRYKPAQPSALLTAKW